MMAHTPGPWRVVLQEIEHRRDSPLCRDTCGNGQVPIRITYIEPQGDWRQTEGHVMQGTWIEDILGADDTHVVCTGHDYDEGGYIASLDDAYLIAAAPELLEALKTARDWIADYSAGETLDTIDAAIAKAEGR